MRDLDAVSAELFDRGIESEWKLINSAQATVGKVCIVFLDQEQLKPLGSIGDVYRRVPGATTDDNCITVMDRAYPGLAALEATKRFKPGKVVSFNLREPAKKTARTA